MTANKIVIHPGRREWLATYEGPHASKIMELFGTTTIPTAFTLAADGNHVANEVCRRNMGVTIELQYS